MLRPDPKPISRTSLPLKTTAHAATYWRGLAAVHDRVYDAGQNLVL